MRVKLSFSFNAIGASSPLYITVTGLTDEEMPIEEDMLVVEVPGLCVGGGVGSNDQVGYVVFTKKNSGADQTRFEHYHKNVLKPMIDKYWSSCMIMIPTREPRFQENCLQWRVAMETYLKSKQWQMIQIFSLRT